MKAVPPEASDPITPIRSRPVLMRWIAALVLTFPLLQAANLALLQHSFTGKVLSNLFQAAASILAAGLTLYAAYRLRQGDNPAARGWTYIAVAMVFDALGMISFMFIEVVLLRPDPYPGLPDVFFLLLYPLMIWGLWQLPREPQSSRERRNNLLDIAALTVLASLFIWQFNLRLLLPELVDQPNAGTWVSLVYTFVDTLLLLMIFSVLVRKLGRGEQFVPMLLLVLGSFFLITADLLQGFVTTTQAFVSGSPIDMGWVLFSTFCSLAALVVLKPVPRSHVEDAGSLRIEVLRTGWTLVITYFWIGMVVVLLVWAVFHRDDFHAGFLIAGVVSALFLAITRQFRTLQENTRLYEQLNRSAAELELKVQQRTTELEQQQVRLLENEQRTRAVFDLSFAFIGLLDTQGTVIDVNQSALRFAGAGRVEVLGRPFWDTPWWSHSPEMRERLQAAVRTAAAGNVVAFEATHPAADGSIRTIDFSLKPVLGEGGEVVMLIPEGRDITERKRAEEILRGSESRAQRQRAGISKLVLDETVAAAQLPQALERITETLADTLEVARASIWRLMHDGDELRCVAMFGSCARESGQGATLKTADFARYFEAIHSESRIAAHDAQTDPRTRELTVGYLAPLGITSILDAGIQLEGRLVGVVCIEHIGSPRRWQPDEEAFVSTAAALVAQVFADAERKRAEAALRESEERYRALFDRSMDCVFLTDFEGRFLDANQAALDLLGYQRNEIKDLTFQKVLHPEQLPVAFQTVEEILRTGHHQKAVEYRARHKNGSEVLVETLSSLIYRDGQPFAIQGIARNITERKAVEAHIRQQAALLDASQDSILVWSQSQGIQYMNPAAEALTGQRFLEAKAKPLGAVLHPRSDLELRAAIQSVTAHGGWSGELELLVGNQQSRTVASRWTTLADDQEASDSILISCNDVTERKQLEAQFLRAQRLESVGTLASGVAHDLNNILSPIIMGLEMLNQSVTDPDLQGILKVMKDSAHRGADTVKQLLTFARGTESHRGPVQPRHLVKEIVRLLQQTFPKNIQIITDYTERPDPVLADPSQLHQVLMNLCVNARDAMPEGGVLSIVLENRTLHETETNLHPKARPIPYVIFHVSDSGSGIPPEILDRIFDPFFTTKPQGKGTGLGLATVLGIVEAHGGFVLVESKPKQGSAFRVFLPSARVAEGDDSGPKPSTAAPGGGRLVLIVDDESAILRVATRVMRNGGYRTLAATSAAEALSLFEANPGQINAVLTDVMMPFGDGRQLISTLRERDPSLTIIAMSGHATSEFEVETLDRGASAFVSKPFHPDQLLTVLGKALAGTAA